MCCNFYKYMLFLCLCIPIVCSCSSGNVEINGDADIADSEQDEFDLDILENDEDKSDLSDGDSSEASDWDYPKPDGDVAENEVEEYSELDDELETSTDGDNDIDENSEHLECTPEEECCTERGFFEEAGTACTDDSLCTFNDKCDATGNCSGKTYSCGGENGSCNGDGSCSCNNEFMNIDCSACLENYIGFPDCAWDGTSYPEDFCTFNICTLVTPTNQESCHDYDDALTNCVGEASSATCGSTDYCGQDAQYEQNERTFVCYDSSGTIRPCSELPSASNNEVIKDLLTGLTWQRIYKDSTGWQEAITHCENLEYAEHDDWRMPTLHELYGIMNNENTGPCLDGKVFPELTIERLWSGTTDASNSSIAWSMNIGYGSTHFYDKTELKSFFCVRKNSPDTTKTDTEFNRFIISEDETTVTDFVTGLVWDKQSTSSKTWKVALKDCENSSVGGFEDWRLPNIKELVSLVNYGKHDPSTDFPNASKETFWSSTSRADDSMHAWVVTFVKGGIGLGNKPNRFDVRCVRGGP